MAALITRTLRDVPVKELRPLLQEEAEYWGEELLWDYTEVSQAVAAGLERRTLIGRVAHDGARAAAYCYYMLDSGRAIVGAVFAARDYRGQGIEERLLDDVLADAQAAPGNERVECQTLFSTAGEADRRFLRAGFKSRRRHYLVCTLDKSVSVPAPAPVVELRPIKREDLWAVSEIIYRSHHGSLDAALNLTYATPTHCRGFVETLVLRSGCGRFDAQASFLVEGHKGPQAVLLASRLSSGNGHICQVSVAPEAQGRGLGSALMSAALRGFREEGLETASLSVTVENQRAYQLYRRLGFSVRKEFAAHAWVRPPALLELPA
jgi:ribosomal protein S18 acetylase RimI-like enzyme